MGTRVGLFGARLTGMSKIFSKPSGSSAALPRTFVKRTTQTAVALSSSSRSTTIAVFFV